MTTPRDRLAGSDEAVEAAAAAIERQLRQYGDSGSGAVGWGASPRRLAEVAFDAVAARVRAEAVAGERQRIAELVTAALVPDDVDEWSDNNEGWNRALGRVLRDLRAAAGSVPVATPPESDPRCPADLEGARCSLFRGHQDNHATSFGKRGQDALGRSYDGAWFEWADVAVPVATPTSEREQAGGDGLRSVSRAGQLPGRLPVDIGHTSDTELLRDALRGWIDQRSSAFSAEDFDAAGSLLRRVDAVLAVPVATPEPSRRTEPYRACAGCDGPDPCEYCGYRVATPAEPDGACACGVDSCTGVAPVGAYGPDVATEPSVGTGTTEDVESAPISPEFRQRLIAAANRSLRVRRAVLLLAGHASGHLPGAEHACRTCHTGWPCEAVHRAAQPALEAFAECDASLAAPSVGTGTPAQECGCTACTPEGPIDGKCRCDVCIRSAIWHPESICICQLCTYARSLAGTPAGAVSGGSGHAERQEPATDDALTEAFTAGFEQCRRRAVTAEADVERLTDEVAHCRAVIEETVELLETPSAGWPRRVHSILAAALGDGA